MAALRLCGCGPLSQHFWISIVSGQRVRGLASGFALTSAHCMGRAEGQGQGGPSGRGRAMRERGSALQAVPRRLAPA
eukprot:3844866-Pleurochrysis_carterae.AAC.1